MTESGQTSTEALERHPLPEGGGIPPGDHPLEIAARSGYGPLSPAAIEVWHGGGQPCVTCGQLVRRESVLCDHCGQDLSSAMIERMRAHAGPWYVLEHVRPFPGVSLDRIIRQVHRGLITETSIVRGPATDYQWRFAVETPGLCRLFRRCWKCRGEAKLAETECRTCGASLSFDRSVAGAPSGSITRASGRAERVAPATGVDQVMATERGRLTMLRAAAESAGQRHASEASADVMKVGGVRLAWLAVVIVIGVFGALVWITQSRTNKVNTSPQSATSLVHPVSPGETGPSAVRTETP